MSKTTKRSVAVVTAAIVGIGGAGAAFAAWLLQGEGSASAASGEAATLVVTPNTTSTTTLVPGGKADVKFEVSNPNTFPVAITDITFSNFTSSNAGCDDTDVEFVDAALPAAAGALNVAAKTAGVNGTKTIEYVGSLRMVADAADECQGATFSFDVDLTAQSNAA
ncbi:hypothetical protein [Actinoplanes sp. NBRC 101535]|uniref:hypothetical protein n=1 Tax=Actinoplanes sp. NBRC 101535 TaxID=3032196 RepID=UPI0024A0EF08|nr:hypothetical protein [Actinoplanes sp. NBRC 101535]GLY01016.1 hypothetical protein Acsp01_13950 [Actinoplanes sp. NBRC 101535]